MAKKDDDDLDTDQMSEEVRKQFDVTRERIRQIEEKALKKLRHPTSRKPLESDNDENDPDKD